MRNEVKQIVAEGLKAFDQAKSVAGAVERYAADKLKDIPAIYHSLLPKTDNAGELAKAEQQIRTQYQADLQKQGIKPPPVAGTPGNAAAGAAPPGAPVDMSKLTADQKIAAGIQQEGAPQRVGTLPPAAAAFGQAK